MLRLPVLLGALALLAATGAAAAPGAGPTGFEVAGAAPALAAPVDDPVAFLFHHKSRSPADSAAAARADSVRRAEEPALNAERAQVVLRSLTIPGWGQATLGHNTAAAVFALVEVGIWTSYAAFRIQETMRTNSYVNTADIFAGINLSGRDDDFRHIVGAYSSSAEYNQLVVARDAASLYLSDPAHLDYASYHAYIAAHQLQGADSWAWDGPASQQLYLGQRKNAERAALRANTALALALINRLVSVLHVTRLQGLEKSSRLNLDVAPVPGTDPTAFRVGVRTRF
jgi:hypothetical protein